MRRLAISTGPGGDGYGTAWRPRAGVRKNRASRRPRPVQERVRRMVMELPSEVMARLARDRAGLVAAVVQQHDTGEVLMLAWMDEEALRRTVRTGRATYWSRSRRRY